MTKPKLIAIFALCLAAAAAHAQKDDATSLFSHGRLFEMEGDWYSAIEAYLQSVDKNPAYADPMLALSRSYYELGEYDQALAWATKAAKYRRGSAELNNLDAFIRIAMGDHSGAQKSLAATLAAEPNNLDARFALALLDLAKGKSIEAAKRYEDALRLSPLNARALLSLSMVYADSGNDAAARAAMEQALRAHGSDAQVQYFAGLLSSRSASWEEAEGYCRTALSLRPGYPEARLLLGTVLLQDSQAGEASKLMEESVASGTRDVPTWFLLGSARESLGDYPKALSAYKSAVTQAPDDEVSRLGLENLLLTRFKPEDPLRETWANYHFKRASDLEDRNFRDQAAFEYRRGLKLYPYSFSGRFGYAKLLKTQGLLGAYYGELSFLKENGQADQQVNDSLEIYQSLLSDSLSAQWGIDQFALKKRNTTIAFFRYPGQIQLRHADAEGVILDYVKDIMTHSGRIAVKDVPPRAGSFKDAFRAAREAGADYFVVIKARENERDVSIDALVYSGRTGGPSGAFNAYRSGNDRLKNSALRISDLISKNVPLRSFLIDRKQHSSLVALGRNDGIAKDDKLLIIKKGKVRLKSEGFGLDYDAADVLGDFTVEQVDEEISQGSMAKSSFFDMINSGDEVVRKTDEKKPEAKEPSFPALYDLIRRIR
jgi:tetratricopeptide (TPR) repeat protein